MNPSIKNRMGVSIICLAALVTAFAGIRGDGVSRGRVLRFGSVVVNGIEFDTSTATIIVDGVQRTQANLRLGQVLSVEGAFDDDGLTGIASTVEFDDNVQGPVTKVDLANSEIVVLGQTVRIDQATLFGSGISPASINGIQVGEIVEVSARPTAYGALQAARIEAKSAAENFNVNGLVKDLTAARFRINQLIVNYSTASLSGFGTAGLREGDTVQATGRHFTSTGALIATKVAMRKRGVSAPAGGIVEVEGFVSEFVSVAKFSVDGQPVRTNSTTVFEGRPKSELGLNADVEVEGILNVAGEVVAQEVDIRADEDLEAEAFVESMNISAGTLRVLGATVQTDAQTEFEDQVGDSSTFALNNIGVGDFLEIRGFRRPTDGKFVATRVRREEAEDEVILQGFVDRVNPRPIRLLGTSVRTTGSTQYENAADQPISATKFFGALRIGSLIKIKGEQTGATEVLADEMEFEN